MLLFFSEFGIKAGILTVSSESGLAGSQQIDRDLTVLVFEIWADRDPTVLVAGIWADRILAKVAGIRRQ
jgi:hypothetical protein